MAGVGRVKRGTGVAEGRIYIYIYMCVCVCGVHSLSW